jgi:hypothetical protein
MEGASADKLLATGAYSNSTFVRAIETPMGVAHPGNGQNRASSTNAGINGERRARATECSMVQSVACAALLLTPPARTTAKIDKCHESCLIMTVSSYAIRLRRPVQISRPQRVDGKRRGSRGLWLRSSIVLKQDNPMVEGKISFGRFRLDFARRELRRDQTPVRLGSRALDILCVMASAGGKVVTKDEPIERVWAGVVDEENNIQVHISALRKSARGRQEWERWHSPALDGLIELLC